MDKAIYEFAIHKDTPKIVLAWIVSIGIGFALMHYVVSPLMDKKTIEQK